MTDHLIGRRRFTQATLLALGAAAMGLPLAGCRNPEGGASRSTSSILRRGTGTEPQTLDPHYVPGNAAAALMYDLYEGLMAVGKAGQVVAGLAEDYDVSDDGLVYTFRLRDGLRWSDGKAITAEDAVYSFRRVADPRTASRGGQILMMVRNFREILSRRAPVESLGVSAVDERTVRIELAYPAPYLPDVLASFSSALVPRHAIEAHGDRWTRPENIVVSGAYTLDRWISNTEIRLRKNPHYHDAANVRIEEVIFYPVERPATAVTRYRAGELDVVFNIPPDQIDSLRAGGFGDAVRSSPTLGVFYVLLNNRSGPTQDVRVREALSLSVDRERISDTLLRGEGTPAYSIVPEAAPDYTGPGHAMRDQDMESRLERARQLLGEAGYSPSRPLAISYKFGGQEINRRVAVALQSMWEAVGVNVTLENVGANSIVAAARNGDFQAMRYQYYAPFQDAAPFLMLLQSGTNVNFSGYADPEYDRLLAEANRSQDTSERMRRLSQAEAHCAADFPVIPIYHNQRNYLVSPRIGGWEENVRGVHLSRYLTLES